MRSLSCVNWPYLPQLLDLSEDPAQWFAVNSHHSLISSGVDQKAILAVDRNRLDVVE
jgi:hypothetical protein